MCGISLEMCHREKGSNRELSLSFPFVSFIAVFLRQDDVLLNTGVRRAVLSVLQKRNLKSPINQKVEERRRCERKPPLKTCVFVFFHFAFKHVHVIVGVWKGPITDLSLLGCDS